MSSEVDWGAVMRSSFALQELVTMRTPRSHFAASWADKENARG